MSDRPWNTTMPDDQFDRMKRILAAPSPIGMEGAMTEGVLAPEFEKWMQPGWEIRRFCGSAGIVLDTHPGEDQRFSVMVIGHADKIRLQVRSIGDDGKVWVNSDSLLSATLIGHEVILFSEDPENPGSYRRLEGGTIEAIGAIHFADPEVRKGKRGIDPQHLYLELHVHGEERKKQIESLGIRPGDPILMNRPIRPGASPHTFYGADLDNGLGCFVTSESARIIAERGGLQNLRLLATIASCEEIGRMGSRVAAGELRPDLVIGVDVAHDLASAPDVGDRRYPPVAMGKGCTLTIGSITSAHLNSILQEVARDKGIPWQPDVAGRDTGTDAMAAVLAGIDAAAIDIGFPIRNMHTISESGHTGDVLAAIHVIVEFLQHLDGLNGGQGIQTKDLHQGHPRLDEATSLELRSDSE